MALMSLHEGATEASQSHLRHPEHGNPSFIILGTILALGRCTLKKAAFAFIVLLQTDGWKDCLAKTGWEDCCSWLLLTLCTVGYPVPNANVRQPSSDRLSQLHD